MIMQMRLQDLRPRYRYEKLLREEGCDDNEEKVMMNNAPPMKASSSSLSSLSSSSSRRRCFWVKKLNGRKAKGVKISRCRKLTWKRFSFLVFPRKIAKIYSEVLKRLIDLDGTTFMFATTWGLPVLSNLSIDKL